uniref:protein WHAT'S THIS FACTOR 1 homolog n=1 Tax=Ziziphus jujuba TaxID=326968 RepID=A0A6P3Z1E8_ZIZJJ
MLPKPPKSKSNHVDRLSPQIHGLELRLLQDHSMRSSLALNPRSSIPCLPFLTYPFSTTFPKQPNPDRSNKKKKSPRPRAELVQSESTRIPTLERLVERDSFFKFLTKSIEFLSKQPQHALRLDDATKLHNELGFLRGRNVAHSIKRHPLIFETYRRRRDGEMWFRLTDFMEKLLEEERDLANSMVLHRVNTLRKLLMMSSEKRIPMRKIHHCRYLFGIPDDFRDRIAKYPDFFRIVDNGDGGEILELVNWDQTLAVSALEKELMVVDEEKVKKAMDLNLDEGEKRKLKLLDSLPLVSPYSDGSIFDACSLEAEKYRLGMLHEFLSLTIEKKAYMHHIVELRNELSLSKNVYQMVLKQPRKFYVAGTVKNWVVFLKDAYDENGRLIKKDPQVVFNEKLYSYAQM